MSSSWANHAPLSTSETFETLHNGLTVNLIATPREFLMTCSADQTVADVMERNQEPYDFLPVVEPLEDGRQRVLGLFQAASLFSTPVPSGTIADHFHHLSEDYLIGADTSILDFVKTADSRPCRLVVSGDQVSGLVSISDLQKLPVRAALFALITGLEMTMADAIRSRFGLPDEWMQLLSDERQEKLANEIEKSKTDDGFIDELLFTQFCDKADIIRKQFNLDTSKSKAGRIFGRIQTLRDGIAHANEYADTPERAGNVCSVVRELLDVRRRLTGVLEEAPATELNDGSSKAAAST